MGIPFISNPALSRHRRAASTLAIMAMVLSTSACTIMAPQYTPSPQNLQFLRDGGAYSAWVGEFGAEPGQQNENPITIRGNAILSPYNGSYAGYLAEALRQELALAKKWSQSADTNITGTVLVNTVNAPASGSGTVDISARFAVMRGSQKRYEQVKSVHHEFPSEFVGAIAILRAIQEYQVAVTKLLGSLYGDQAFIAALKP